MTGTVRKRISVMEGDITQLSVDAIVNAANESLLGGGGVDGAIHAASGPALLKECRKLRGCPTGQAKLTGGYKLPAKYVIHTVGPVYFGGADEPRLLRSCYENSLAIAIEATVESIAFPCISTGVFGYPKAEACDIAVDTVVKWLSTHEFPKHVTFCCFCAEDEELYQSRLKDSVGRSCDAAGTNPDRLNERSTSPKRNDLGSLRTL